MITVTSRDNPVIRHLRALRDKKKLRREEGRFLCEGEKVLAEALAEGISVEELCVTERCLARVGADVRLAEARGARVLCVPEDLLAAVSGVETPQGVAFSAAMPAADPARRPTDLLICDGLRDPGNLGTVIRTADAFGAGGVYLCGDCADVWAPKTVRACMGSIFRVPLYSGGAEQCADFCRANGLSLLCAKPTRSARPLSEGLPPRCAVAVGNEAHGVSAELEARSAGALFVDMSGRAESLNAAVCAAVILWHMQSAREK